jgi:hypothetical protein
MRCNRCCPNSTMRSGQNCRRGNLSACCYRPRLRRPCPLERQIPALLPVQANRRYLLLNPQVAPLPFTIEEWDAEGLHRLQDRRARFQSRRRLGRLPRNGRHAPAGAHPVQARHPRDGRAQGKRPARRLGAIQLAGLTISKTPAPRGPGLLRGAVPFSTGRGSRPHRVRAITATAPAPPGSSSCAPGAQHEDH